MPDTNKKNNLVYKDIEVFKTGVITDSKGDTQEWTLEDLETIAQTYNEKIKEDPGSEAPIVKGHPETDSPAHGWVKKLYVVGETLKAKIGLVKRFADEVKEEMFKKVSIAIYDNLMLRHIGFLGGVQPAVKGLEPVAFSDNVNYRTFYFEEPLPAEGTGDQANTIEAAKQALAERSKIYGIGAKDKIGYIEKPTAYADLTDDDFADPVNYLYPINTKENLLASKATFRPWENDYSQIEQQIIFARFLTAAGKYGLEIKQMDMMFNDVTKSSEFSIQINPDLKRDKPSEYTDYADGDFGDPVHFRFPVKTKSNVRASLAIFSRENVQKQYSEKERAFIASRLIQAAQNQEIKLTPKNWKYSQYIDVPVDMLNKNQLVEVVKSRLENKTNNNFSTIKGKTMDEWLSGFIAAMTQKLSETVNEETATQFQAWADEYKAANALPTGTETPAPEGGTQASEPQIPKEYAERMERLEKENRTVKNERYFEELLRGGKVIPVQKELVLNTLELVHKQTGSMEFSENGKKTQLNPEGAIRKLIESFPKQVEFNEVATGGEVTKSYNFSVPQDTVINDDRMDLHNKILAYQEEQSKQGKAYTYEQAMAIVARQ